jgi:hypothetical protein
MKSIMIYVLFNVFTGATSDPHIVRDKNGNPMEFNTAQDCGKALIEQGIQRPNKAGDVVLYQCLVPPARPEVHLIHGDKLA